MRRLRGGRADPTALLDAFAKRQTARRFKSDPAPEAHLLSVLDAARRAPSCMNQQPWKSLVIRDPAKIERMKQRTLAITHKGDRRIFVGVETWEAGAALADQRR